MAEYTARVAPFINEEFRVTSAQPYYPDGTVHGGFDISTGINSPVYSMTEGTVLYSQYNTGGYGNMIIIQADNGTTLLYAHFRDLPLKNVGDRVRFLEQIGFEGSTGDSTGIHTHLEIQYLQPGQSWNWNLDKLTRPHVADFMGIPNEYDITAIYNGEVPPTPATKQSKFKWVLYANRLRNRNVNIL